MGDDIDWDAFRADLHLKADLLIAHALVHYIHRGHPLALHARNANALRWITHDQFVLLARIDDAEAFWRIRDEMLAKFEAAHRAGRAISEIVGQTKRES